MNTRSSKYFLVIRLGLIFVAGAPTAFAAIDWDAARAKVAKLGELKEAPAMVPAEGVAPDGTMRAIFYDALPWKGKPTRVYAWLGMPTKEQAKGKAKVPGVVLVHGGGGTAFKAWV